MYVCMYDVLEHCYKLVLHTRCTTSSTTVPAAAILVKSVNNNNNNNNNNKHICIAP